MSDSTNTKRVRAPSRSQLAKEAKAAKATEGDLPPARGDGSDDDEENAMTVVQKILALSASATASDTPVLPTPVLDPSAPSQSSPPATAEDFDDISEFDEDDPAKLPIPSTAKAPAVARPPTAPKLAAVPPKKPQTLAQLQAIKGSLWDPEVVAAKKKEDDLARIESHLALAERESAIAQQRNRESEKLRSHLEEMRRQNAADAKKLRDDRAAFEEARLAASAIQPTAASTSVLPADIVTTFLDTVTKAINPSARSPANDQTQGKAPTAPRLVRPPTLESAGDTFCPPLEMQGQQSMTSEGSQISGYTTCLPLNQVQSGALIVGLMTLNGSELSWDNPATDIHSIYVYLGGRLFRRVLAFDDDAPANLACKTDDVPLLILSRTYYEVLKGLGYLHAETALKPWFPKDGDASASSTQGSASQSSTAPHTTVMSTTSEKVVSTSSFFNTFLHRANTAHS
jgi:hypothetical protein